MRSMVASVLIAVIVTGCGTVTEQGARSQDASLPAATVPQSAEGSAAVPTATAGPSATDLVDVGCPTNHVGDWSEGQDTADWVDLVEIGGRRYVEPQSSPLEPDQLGELLGVVCYRLADMTFREINIPTQDGDATLLAVGTELRAIPGADPSDQLAAVTPDGVLVYVRKR
jgi:hypothetical protein